MIVKHNESINVSGTLASLEVGESCTFEEKEINLSYLRTKASDMGRRFGRRYSVSADRSVMGNKIVVTRTR